MAKVILFLLKIPVWGYFILPRGAQVRLGVLLGALLRMASLRSEVVRSNLRIAYPGDDDESVGVRARLYRESYHHLGHLFFEILLLLGPLKSFVNRYVRMEGLDHWRRAQAQGKGVLFLSSHVGNWEVMAAGGGLSGIPLMIVTKQLKPPELHAAIEAGRARCGVRGTYEPKTLKDVLRHLKEGKTVGFVLDQYAGPPVGVRVPFFNTPVGTSTAVATLARRTGAPVLPVVNFRRPDGGWTVRIEEPLEWRKENQPQLELAVNTARFVARVEKHVREHPGQWLWIHRRFKGDLSPLREGEWELARARR